MREIPRTRIFVVDDERNIAETLCLILESAGYEALPFFNAEDALSALPHAYPALVISDVILDGMSGVSGIDLQKMLQDAAPDIKVILFSGHGTTSMMVEDARKRGQWVAVHAKPLAPERLLLIVERLLRPESEENRSPPIG